MGIRLQDLKYALRSLRGSPGTTLVAVGSLALALGANVSIFSALDALLFRPLPFPEPERIVQVWTSNPSRGWDELNLSLADAEDVAKLPEWSGSASFTWGSANLVGEGEPERIQTVEAGGGFFEVIGVQAALGRTLAAGETGPGAPAVAVLSHGFWQRHFGADPAVLGKVVSLDERPVTVVGVMPKTFEYPSTGIDAWLPLTAPVKQTDRAVRWTLMVARLAPGVTVRGVHQALADLGSRLSTEYPESNAGFTFRTESLRDHLYGPIFEQAAMILQAAVLFVLLVACANVANLLLARTVSRTRETALRTALGASRGRIILQHLLEGLAIAIAGGLAGSILAVWGTEALRSVIPASVPRASEIGLSLPALGYGLALSIVSGLAFGVAPALRAGRAAPADVLKDGARGAIGGRRSGRVRMSLVVAEIAVAVVLTMSAGLMVRSFIVLRHKDRGYDPSRLLTLSLTLPEQSYPNDTAIAVFVSRLEPALRSIPGARAATIASILPASGSNSRMSFTIAGQPAPPPGERPSANVRQVTPGFFQALDIPLVQGRGFADQDRIDSPGVVVVNQSFVRRYLGSVPAVGTRILLGEQPFTIVGVMRNYIERDLDEPQDPTVLLPFAMVPERRFEVGVRSVAEPALLAGVVRDAVRRLDPTLPLADVATMEARIVDRRRGDWVITRLLLALAGLGLALAVTGVFGVMAYTVSQRRAEMGVRLAVGASARDILELVLRQGARLAAAGLAVGLIGSVGAGVVLRAFLKGTSALDPWTYLLVSVLLGAVVLLACWVPARRAACTDPMTALRNE
jgi:putative ABC transport system permease protein